MAFIFSDLVVFPVLRTNAAYYGWKMALYIMGMLLASLVGTSLLMHGGLALADLLPEGGAARMAEQPFFKTDYTFFLNIAFLVASGVLGWLWWSHRSGGGHGGGEQNLIERALFWAALASCGWLAGGLLAFFDWWREVTPGGKIPGRAFVLSPVRTVRLSSMRFRLLRCPNSPPQETANLIAATKRPKPARGGTSCPKKCAWTTSVRSSGARSRRAPRWGARGW
jgi:hypothetical protein